ncbi:MAG: acetate--CoA ligase family protein [bacterium]
MTDSDLAIQSSLQTECLIVYTSEDAFAATIKSALQPQCSQNFCALIPLSDLTDEGISLEVKCGGVMLREDELSVDILTAIEELSKNTAVLVFLLENSSAPVKVDPFSAGTILSHSDCLTARLTSAGALRLDQFAAFLNVLRLLCQSPIPAGSRTALICDDNLIGQMVLSSCAAHDLPIQFYTVASPSNITSIISEVSPKSCDCLLLALSDTASLSSCLPSFSAMQTAGISCLILHNNLTLIDPFSFSLQESEQAIQAVKALISLSAIRLSRGEKRVEYRCNSSVTLKEYLHAHSFGFLPETVVKKALLEYGIPVIDEQPVKIYSTTLHAAVDLGFPLALKILAPEIHNKQELGGVALNIVDEDELRQVWQQFNAEFSAYDYVLQRMIPPGLEFIVEARQDEVLGPIMAFGLAGAYTSLYHDVATVACPAEEHELMNKLRSLRCYPMLIDEKSDFYINPEVLSQILANLSTFMLCNPDVQVLRLDPLLGRDSQFLVLDAKAFISLT